MTALPNSIRRLVSEMRKDLLEVRVENVPLPALAPGQLLLRVEAAPLHPSDLGTMLAAGDVSHARRAGSADLPAIHVPVPESARPMMAARFGSPVPVGNEGAGTIVAAGDAEGEALIGRRVTAFAGGMYADYRVLPISAVMPLPEGATARDGAAVSVNPLTALAMIEVMRRDGAKALVHTAAASSLGQILQRICAMDGVPLVNIVRRPGQETILRGLGATHVLNLADAQFMMHMIDTFAELDVTIAFDAVGGGGLAGMLLTAMEQAQIRRTPTLSPYGSATPKRVYIYGRLDPSPTLVPPTVGMAWGLSGFLLPHFLDSAGAGVRQRLAARVMRELKTTFAISYTEETSLAGLLDPERLKRANAKSTNDKLLVCPQT